MEEVSYLRFFFALAFVLGLIGITAVLFKKLALDRKFMGGGGKRRLGIVEVLPIDNRRRLVLVKRDSQEHLLLIGGGADLVIEMNTNPETGNGEKTSD